MTPLQYKLARTIRRNIPQSVMRFILQRKVGVVPGIDTRFPDRAVDRYQDHLNRFDLNLAGKRILLFGYGGSFGVGVELLRRGARHVILSDPFARPDSVQNYRYFNGNEPYLLATGEHVQVNPDWLTLSHKPIAEAQADIGDPVDLILSSSVFEHLIDPEHEMRSLMNCMTEDGAQLHIIDLRDHYFKYPFEMLCHSEDDWLSKYNPPSHLNRYRYWDYQVIFKQFFSRVEIEIIMQDPAAFDACRARIQPEFVSGNQVWDTAAKIVLVGMHPRSG